MIREELQHLSTTPRDLRKFGLVVGGVFALLGGWFLFRHKPAGPCLLAPGVLLVLFGLVAPRLLRPVHVAWMTLAFVLGFVVSTVLLTLLFLLVVTPTGLAARSLGKDFLSRKLDRRTTSYWRPRGQAGDRSPADYERQF